MKKNIKSIGVWVLLFAVIITIFALVMSMDTPEEKTYDDLVRAIVSRSVTELEIIDGKRVIAKLNDESKINIDIQSYESLKEDVPDIANQMAANTLAVKFTPPKEIPWYVQMLPTLGLILILVIFWLTFMQQSQGGGGRGMSFSRSHARMHLGDKNTVKFSDVAGADEEKNELEEIVEFLKHPERFCELGARIPKGVLLVGPPGTGKTLLGKAVAGEAGVPFFSISGSDFVEMYVGVGASRVRDLFEQAKKHLPCIIFIDEIDAVGRHRGAGHGGGHDEREQTLNQLLVEMDGFGINEGIIILAATNRPDILDPALLRPGRFDRQVVVSAPDVKGREDILKVHSRNKPLNNEVNLTTIAKGTVGFTGADLENLMNEAALLAARQNKKDIGMNDIETSITKVIMGPEKKSRIRTEKDNKLTAYHEVGHAIVTHVLPTQDPVHLLSIIPRGNANGYMLSLPKEDKYSLSKSDMLEDITTLLSGRVAEELVLDDISTGASNDIERATKIARSMVTKYGMSKNLGAIMLGTPNEEVFMGKDYGHIRDYSEKVAAEIDEEVKSILGECYAEARSILEHNVDKLHKIAGVLLEKEKLEADDFEELFNE